MSPLADKSRLFRVMARSGRILLEREKVMGLLESSGIAVFSTCPQSADTQPEVYLRRVKDVARWSEEAGCRGILVYSDNRLVDPWLVSQVVVEATQALSPLVAVQPIYMHPYAAAKMVASLAYLHGRRSFLNMVAGGFKNDLVALGDMTPHDERYQRVTEYTLIMKSLLAGDPVTLTGRYHHLENLRLSPPVPSELYPGILISGSSPAGLAAARAIGAIAVKYPEPLDQIDASTDADGIDSGIRVGIIARETGEEAWFVAHERFPEDRKGQMTHALAMKVSDSQWHRQLSELADQSLPEANPYWLGPFQNYKTFCPYLVGSYARVSKELAGYIDLGFKTFILDIPPTREELDHIQITFGEAMKQASR
jgi:alkanesulfonate monooxygenase